jgi:hypothetical protein
VVKARGKAAFKTLQPYVQQLLQSGATEMQVTVLGPACLPRNRQQ